MCKIESIPVLTPRSNSMLQALLQRYALVLFLGLLSSFAACPAGQAQDQQPQQQTEPNQQNPQTAKPAEVPQQTPTAGAPVDSNSYKVGPADVLNIRVWHETEFSGPVAVHQDGKITLPLIGDLQAGGLTPAQIEESITKALTRYVVKPLVTVTVQEVLSKKYYLDGEIARPGEYPLIAPTTVFEAISKAGGLAGFANGKKIYVLRGDKRIPFNLKDVSHGKHMEQNILLQPGDHIVIP